MFLCALSAFSFILYLKLLVKLVTGYGFLFVWILFDDMILCISSATMIVYSVVLWTIINMTDSSSLTYKDKEKLLLEIEMVMYAYPSERNLTFETKYFLMHRADSLKKKTDAGKDWRQEEKGMGKDEMVGWHHQFNGHESEQTLGNGEGLGSLECCSLWVTKSWAWLSDWTTIISLYVNV